MSDIVTATAMANASSGVRRPLRIVRWTFTGSVTVESTAVARPELASARCANFETGPRRRLFAAVAWSLSTASIRFVEFFNPRIGKFVPSTSIEPPSSRTSM